MMNCAKPLHRLHTPSKSTMHKQPIVAQSPRGADVAHKPNTIDEYLDRLTDDKRAALQKLRQAIKTAAPRVEECISYQVPAFRLDGKMLVWFAAAAKHCSFFPGAYPINACER